MFSQESSKAISDQYVAVRITGGNDKTPEVEAFMSQYKVRGYPTLFVMNAEGHVGNADVGRSAEAMLESLAKGAELETEFNALEGKDDVESKTKRATMLADRMLFDEAKAALDALVAEAPSAGVFEAMADFHQKQGDTDAELALLGTMITDYPQADNRTKWRVRVAVAPTDAFQRRRMPREEALAIAGTAADNLRVIFDELTAAESPDNAQIAEVRASLYPILSMQQKRDEAEAHVEWLIANAADTEHAAPAMWQRGVFQINDKAWGSALATFNALMDKYPDSMPGQSAPRAIDYIQKQQAAAEAAEADDDSDDGDDADDGADSDDDDHGHSHDEDGDDA